MKEFVMAFPFPFFSGATLWYTTELGLKAHALGLASGLHFQWNARIKEL